MITLDWHDREHWGGDPQPCHLCGMPALLLDSAGHPAHKVCVEATLADIARQRGEVP